MAGIPARSRGELVPLDGFAGAVVVATRAAIYAADRDQLVELRPESRFNPGTHTATSIVAPFGSVSPGTRVNISRGFLHIDATEIDLHRAAVWRAPAPAVADEETVLRRIGFLYSTPDADSRLGARIAALTAALHTGPRPALAALVGYGPGLTPSGDDAVVGLLAVAHRTGLASITAALAPALAALADRTTVVGAHQLRLAADGHFAQLLVDTVDAVARPAVDECDLLRSLVRLRQTGATTGADLLVGVRAGFELLVRELAAA